jgi:hypothetical protein
MRRSRPLTSMRRVHMCDERRRSAVTVSSEIKLMPWLRTLPMRRSGYPKGVLGRLGGMIMARMNRDAAECSVG